MIIVNQIIDENIQNLKMINEMKMKLWIAAE